MRVLLIMCFWVWACPLMGAELSGIVTGNGQPLAYANVFVKNTTYGTTTNLEGEYTLSLDSGSYTLVFQYIGYQKQEKTIEIGEEPQRLDIELLAENYLLQEIVVSSDQEDPAIGIIRNAQARRKFYLEQMESYSCDAYVKGLQRLVNAPTKFLGFDIDLAGLDSNRTGIVYLSESVSEYYFQQPDESKEVIIASKMSGNDNGFSFNRASEMQINFYESNIDFGPLSPRGFISPIANNSFTYYDYELEGKFLEDGKWINKIKLLPKRKHDPSFQGYVYIQDSTWRLHSLDLMIAGNPSIEFVDTFQVSQVFTKYNEDVWVLFSEQFDFSGKILAFETNGTFTGVYSNYEVNQAFEDKFFGGADVKIVEGSNEKDSTYWEYQRPVKLTSEETIDYIKKDSIQLVQETPEYKDSIDRRNNRPNLLKLLVFGYSYQNSIKKHSFSFTPLIENLNYNTVEGLNLGIGLTYTKRLEKSRFYQLSTRLRHGFSNRRFNADLRAFYYIYPKRLEWIRLSGGVMTKQVDGAEPIGELINTFYTLLDGENHMKLYQDRYASVYYQRSLFSGFVASVSASFSDRLPLRNSSLYSFRKVEKRNFTDNISFNRHQAFSIELAVDITFKQQYEEYPDRLFVYGSKYPKLRVAYKKGIPRALSSDVDYDLLSLSIYDDMDFKMLGSSSYRINLGWFLRSPSVPLMDAHIFSGNRTLLIHELLGAFQLGAYYDSFTTDKYMELFYEHHFNGFLFNKIPLVRRSKFRTVIGVNAFLVSRDQYNVEAFIGIENIFKVLRVDYVQSFTNFKSRGVRINLPLPN